MKKFLTYFMYTYLCEINGRDFYYKSKIGSVGYQVYMKNIKIYDVSGKDDHVWNYKFAGIYSAGLDNVKSILREQRHDFFTYEIEKREWR